MKTKLFIAFLFVAIISFQSCDVIQQMITFTKCEFKMKSLTNTKLVGINIQNKKSFSDLNMLDAANATKSLLSGKLPLTFQLNIETRNPNQTAASMQKMEWKLYIDDILITTGKVDKLVTIPAGGVENLPIQIDLDLKELFNNKTKTALLNFGFNLTDSGNYPTRVRLDIKPTITVSGIAIEYPGYFSLKKEFGAQ
ncbi:MAG: LEA type 2 family protein [Bacteroidales bacterium]|nr:LEA type 2 family protein [Bacteroidales bacterium]MBN2755652.1 LEA type 2 family protein [Bacteroidales bacterium]